MPLCSICHGLDFTRISRTTSSEIFIQRRTGHLCSYLARDPELRHLGNVLTPYHKNIESLHASARLCDLCRLVQGSVNAFIQDPTSTKLRSGCELWIGGRHDFDGFQVIGFDTKEHNVHLTCYLMVGVGFCLENG
jgi:hypothetical protein